MTRKNNNNETTVDSNDVITDDPVVETENNPADKKKKKRNWALPIALLALLLVILLILSGWYFYKAHERLMAEQQATVTRLSSTLSSDKQSQNQQNSELQDLVEQVNQQLQQVQNENKLVSSDLQSLQRRVAETNVRQPNDWILSEVEYLVRLAGSKIWIESDVQTAISLLAAADQRLLVLSDPSLSPLRAALLEDINSLGSLPKRDPDGVVLALSSLESRIDKLMVAGFKLSEPTQSETGEVSSDIKDWSENLSKSWNSFVESFIVINTRDVKVEALLSPQQSWYLKENLRGAIAKAEFAVYREQQDIYDLAMQKAVDILTGYYDLTDNTTDHFLKSIQRLSKQKVSVNYPEQLKSAPILERIMTQRVKKSLASSSVK
ncbi:uroporphyrinogen-III C-methyltransferase [Psychromonas sp.]|uniref:uroporphyrinogen-III C-methyltransferase n=1 Tax=Psychromonas sp. TaxID=1884585 RepID=UPI0035675B54